LVGVIFKKEVEVGGFPVGSTKRFLLDSARETQMVRT
jgi:hypothetical protein